MQDIDQFRTTVGITLRSKNQVIVPPCIKKGNDGPFSRDLLRSILVNFCDSADVSSSSLLCNCLICSKKFSMRILFALFLSSSICTESEYKVSEIEYIKLSIP